MDWLYQKIWETACSGGYSFGVFCCFLVGALEGVKLILSVASWAYRSFLRPEINFKKYGKWAVVTGATDGIGKAYCKEFAKRGLNVFLLSRTESKLIEVAQELGSQHGVRTDYMVVDFSKVARSTWSQIKSAIHELDVAVLVNNVGCSYEHYEYLHNIDDQTVDNLIEINVRATTEMTRVAIPGMLERGRGLVVNIGSGVGSVLPASPLLAVYAGTKAFIEQFTKCCDAEYRTQGVLFQDQAPLFVATKMSKIRRAQLTIPAADTWVAGAIKCIGYEQLTTGFWIHTMMWGVMWQIPDYVLQSFALVSAGHLRAKAILKKRRGGKKET